MLRESANNVTRLHIFFLKTTSNCIGGNNLDGHVEVNVFWDVSVVLHIWPSVKKIINSCNCRMIVFMKKFGINKDAYLSPLCENIKTVSNTLEAYIDYCTR